MEQDVERLWEDKRLEEIKFVGSGIAKKVDEYLKTGRLRLLDELQSKIPPGVPALTKVQGIGPRTAFRLSHELGINSVEELQEALDTGRLDSEFGPTVRESFRVGIEKMKSFEKRMLLPEAEGVFQRLEAYLGALGVKVGMAGSLRRGKSTVGDLDLVSTDPTVIDAVSACPGVRQVIEKGSKRASVRLEGGIQVDVRLFTKEEYGAALVYFTGSKDHDIVLRSLAIRKGWKLNEYGLFDGAGSRLAGASEEEVYAGLGLKFVPPELRENTGEIEASAEDRLPKLIKMDDVRGDLQMHTTWSDGSAELEAMAWAAKERGYEYIAVTDHSASVRVANGLTEQRFRRQWTAIEALNEKMNPFRILRGVELEIRADGSLDFDGKFLDEFDMVGASLHQNFKQGSDKLTERVIKALSNPSVDFLCHPTNRLIGKREANPLDAARVIRAARENGKMLEIDGEPDRLDMDEAWARRAMEEGVQIVIDSDAHSVGQLDNIAYGVTVARRSWLEFKHVTNTKSLKSLLNSVA